MSELYAIRARDCGLGTEWIEQAIDQGGYALADLALAACELRGFHPQEVRNVVSELRVQFGEDGLRRLAGLARHSHRGDAYARKILNFLASVPSQSTSAVTP